MSHDTLVRDLLVGIEVATARDEHQRVHLVAHESPQARFAVDTALLTGEDLAVTGYVLDQMTRFEAGLSHRTELELAALPGSKEHP